MKIIKKILLVIVVLIAIVLVAALFVKKDLAAEKEITINKPKQQVFEYIKLLKNQNEYSKWSSMDPNMKKDFRGTDGTVGFVSTWDGNSDVGKGEQEIKKIEEGKRIDYELRFEKPIKSNNKAYMLTEAINDSTTKVKWGFSGKIPYPFNVLNIFGTMTKDIGNDFQVGLQNLKKNMEK